MSRLPVLAVALALAASLTSCGRDAAPPESRIPGDTLTVYSSLPLRGPLAPMARDLVRAEKLALAEADGKAGPWNVNFVSLNASNEKTGRWDAGVVAANARRAVSDQQAVAYLGELESGASSISVPLVNEAGLLQVSPLDSFGGLTAPGAPDEPERYYPSGRRTFTRVVAGDDVQARVLARLVAARPGGSVVVADDGQLAGRWLADRVALLLERQGATVEDRVRLDTGDGVPESATRALAERRAGALVYTGADAPLGLDLLRAAHEARPSARLFAADDLALSPNLTGAAGNAADQLVVTAPDLPDDAEARGFRRRFAAAYGRTPAREAILGYRAMRLVLESVERVGAGAESRRAVIAEALEVQSGPSVGFSPYEVRGDLLVRVRPPM